MQLIFIFKYFSISDEFGWNCNWDGNDTIERVFQMIYKGYDEYTQPQVFFK